MNALLCFTVILALASPIFGDENTELNKKQEKRGIVDFGYGGNYLHGGAHGLTGYTGYGGLGGYGHGYVGSAPLYSLASHGIGHGWNYGSAVAPSVVHGYSAIPAISGVAPYSHGYNHHVPSLLSAPWHGNYHGYNALHGVSYGHGLKYANGW